MYILLCLKFKYNQSTLYPKQKAWLGPSIKDKLKIKVHEIYVVEFINWSAAQEDDLTAHLLQRPSETVLIFSECGYSFFHTCPDFRFNSSWILIPLGQNFKNHFCSPSILVLFRQIVNFVNFLLNLNICMKLVLLKVKIKNCFTLRRKSSLSQGFHSQHPVSISHPIKYWQLETNLDF